MRSGRSGEHLKLLKYKQIDCRISDPAALPNLAEIRRTQPRRGAADNFGMYVEPEPAPEDFYTALWIGALLIAGDTAIDAFPGELDELAKRFFERFRPIREGVALGPDWLGCRRADLGFSWRMPLEAHADSL